EGGDLENLVPDPVEDVDEIHGRILPAPPVRGARRGLPRLVVAPRPGRQPTRSVSAGSPSDCSAGVWPPPPARRAAVGRVGRGFPIEADDSRPPPSRPSSHAEPAVRAP